MLRSKLSFFLKINFNCIIYNGIALDMSAILGIDNINIPICPIADELVI